MATTSVYGWHYPASSDAPDGATQMQILAQDIESTVSAWGLVAPMPWTSMTVTGGATAGKFCTVKRHVTGIIEVKIDINVVGISQSDMVIATLPSWARPAVARSFPAYSSNAHVTGTVLLRFDISTDGTIKPQLTGLTGATFLGFSALYTP